MKKILILLSALAVALTSCTKVYPDNPDVVVEEPINLTYTVDVMNGTKTVTSISLKCGMDFSSSAYFDPHTDYKVILRSPIQQSTVYLYNHGTFLLGLNNQNHNEVTVNGKELNPFVIELTTAKKADEGISIARQ